MRHLLLCLFLLLCSWIPLEKGLDYESCTTSSSQKVYLLKIDPHFFTIAPQKAYEEALGLKSVLDMVLEKGAVAGINGGFFKASGLPAGILKIGDKWYSTPLKPRGAIGWKEGHAFPLIDQLLTEVWIETAKGHLKCSGINQPSKENAPPLYSWVYNGVREDSPFELWILQDKIAAITPQTQEKIPQNGWTLSFKNAPFTFQINERAKVSIRFRPAYTSPQSWEEMDYIVGGTPVLIREGLRISDFSSEKTIETFLTRRHARTAIGILPSKEWIFLVVDGTPPSLFGRSFSSLAFSKSSTDVFQPIPLLLHLSQNSKAETVNFRKGFGMTMNELAEFMETLGCIEALNLDGGDSSILVVGGNVINCPFQYNEADGDPHQLRKVSDAILLFRKKY